MRKKHKKQKGIALLVAMLFVMVFSALSIGMFTMSVNAVQTSDNHHKANEAFNAALSGLETVRYCMNDIIIPPDKKSETERFAYLTDHLDVELLGSENDPILLGNESTFYATLSMNGTSGISVHIMGQSGQISRTIGAGFTYGTRDDSVFDFGVATKGPLLLDGGTLTSSVKSGSDVYIESLNDPDALGVLKNKSEISGIVKIVNANATIGVEDIKGMVGGLTGQDAIDQTIEVGVIPTEFPYPDAHHFEQYATGGDYTSGDTLTNMRITAGTDLKFVGNTTINGILYIEAPNNVEFGGNVTINGMIICEGDWEDNSATNSLAFTGSVDSHELPADSQYDAMRDETGTFVMAPGFDLSFTGSFGTVNGVISGNGISFSGNAGGTVNGSVINYSDEKMTVVGSSDIIFNRTGITEIPAGFVQETVIHYDPTTYDERPI